MQLLATLAHPETPDEAVALARRLLREPDAARSIADRCRGLLAASVDPRLARVLELALLTVDPEAVASRTGDDAELRWLRALAGAPIDPGPRPEGALETVAWGAGAARHAQEPLVPLRAALLALRTLPTEQRPMATRWLEMAEAAAGLRCLVRSGTPVHVAASARAVRLPGQTVTFGRAALRFELLATIAEHGPELDRVGLYERVWGLPWRESASKNALGASLSRLRNDLGRTVRIRSTGGRYRLDPGLTLYIDAPRAPGAPGGAREPAQGELVGREGFVARVREQLDEGPVVLMGLPGVGKTRIAEELAAGWSGPVFWVALETAPEPLQALQDALGVRAPGPSPLHRALAAWPGSLLVLDGLDRPHLSALAPFLHDTRTVATSRRQAPGLASLEVPPLAPDAAATLLTALAARRDTRISREEAAALAERQPVPLALRLVAGRLAWRTPAELLAEEASDYGQVLATMSDALAPGSRALLQAACVVSLPRSLALLAPVAGLTLAMAEAAAADLADRGLAERRGHRLELHAVVREHAHPAEDAPVWDRFREWAADPPTGTGDAGVLRRAFATCPDVHPRLQAIARQLLDALPSVATPEHDAIAVRALAGPGPRTGRFHLARALWAYRERRLDEA
ncbi:MAG: AAA family ATPase, partial [Myxococcales bacterium]|nr:AAA family ATPase [Myxococcales bacterium]